MSDLANDGWSGKVRMLPCGPVGPQNSMTKVGAPEGSAMYPNMLRAYSSGPGQIVDAFEADVSTLTNSKTFAAICASGGTSNRPNNKYLRPGFLYLDIDIALIVAWDGAVWRNPITGAIA